MADTDILTLDEALAAVNMVSEAVPENQRLQRFVAGISQRVDILCGPVVGREVADERHDGGKGRIFPHRSPVLEVTSLSEWEGGIETVLTAETLVDRPPASYLLDHTERLAYIWRRSSGHDSRFPPGRRNIVVTYTAGRFATTAEVDERFKSAVSSILSRIYKRETAAWSQSPSFFPDVEDPAPSVGPGFFKAFDPMITEWLADELLPPPGY